MQEKSKIIESQNFKIKQLEASLQMQLNQNQGKSNIQKSETKIGRFKIKMNPSNQRTKRYPKTCWKNQKSSNLKKIR